MPITQNAALPDDTVIDRPTKVTTMTSARTTSSTALWIRHKRKVRTRTRVLLVGVAAVAYLLLVCAGLASKAVDIAGWGASPHPTVVVRASEGSADKKSKADMSRLFETRWKRDAAGSHVWLGEDAGGGMLGEVNEDNETCTPRAVNNFPGNFFTLKDTQDGGVFLHILIAIYLFAALAIVCDDYFVPALEKICEELRLQADVAGATFMAAGSSAPELCTSIVGVFIAKSDVGVGTIVGSAVFNILFIVGACGIFAAMVVDLTWYPLLRDTVFYLLSVLALVLVIQDSEVHWYEALVMLVMYGLYIVLMYFNRRLEDYALHALASCRARWRGVSPAGHPDRAGEEEALLGESYASDAGSARGGAGAGTDGARKTGDEGEAETDFNESAEMEKIMQAEEHHQYESPWEIPDNFFVRIYWVAMLPVKAICFLGIPDCRRPGIWKRLYLLSFLFSVIWIGIFTYVMVWMITIAGDALEIPDTVMGLTLLAAGTSLPDCLSSVLVARDGLGDMAVSNSVGSNVFDILLCLGLPWLIETAIINEGDHLTISSSGLIYSSLTLLATVAFLLVSVAANGWRLTTRYGLLCLLTYVVVIVLSSLFELNVFGDLNPPSCPR